MAGTGAKGKKIGRCKSKCAEYKLRGKRVKNALKRARTLLRRLEKRDIRPKDQSSLKGKIMRLENAA